MESSLEELPAIRNKIGDRCHEFDRLPQIGARFSGQSFSPLTGASIVADAWRWLNTSNLYRF